MTALLLLAAISSATVALVLLIPENSPLICPPGCSCEREEPR